MVESTEAVQKQLEKLTFDDIIDNPTKVSNLMVCGLI